MLDAAESLQAFLSRFWIPEGEDKHWILLSFDEAQCLPTRLGSDSRLYSTLCRVLKTCASDRHPDLAIFAIFLSSSPSISHLVPSSLHLAKSSREVMPTDVPAPFIELGFDEFDGSPILCENEKSLGEVCSLDFMVRFGRPL